MKKLRLAVFASGRGSNFLRLIETLHRPGIAEIALLICDKAGAPALSHAQQAGVETALVSYGTGRESAEAEIETHLARAAPDLLVLCGFMRVLSPRLVSRYPLRIANIHPSLLPAFPGLHAQRQALHYGVKMSGCTVHFVDSGVDSGPIIAQRAVPVEPFDNEAALAARILEEEHRLFPEVLQLLAREWPPENLVEKGWVKVPC